MAATHNAPPKPAAARKAPPARTPLLAAAAVAVIAPASVLFALPQPVRLPLVVALLCWAPGYAIARSARIEDGFLFAATCVAASLAVTVLGAVALVLVGGWRSVGLTLVVGAVTLALALAQLLRRSRA